MTEAGGAEAAQGLWPGGAAWIDGGYCPVEEAKISVLDLVVTRSDATYDVVHAWRGRFYRLDDHLDRFAASCAARWLASPAGRFSNSSLKPGKRQRRGG